MTTPIQRLADSRTIDDFLAALGRGREIFALEPAEGRVLMRDQMPTPESGRSLPVLQQRSTRQYHLVRADHWDADRHTLGTFRQVEPLKSILFQPREFFGKVFESPEAKPLPERIVIGVKNCDLAGLDIQDHVFGGLPPGDPRYLEARQKTILVSCDCSDCLDVCFCPIVGQQPYAEKGYDVNISPLSRGYLIDAGSERGVALLEEVPEYLAPAEDELLAERDRCRAAMTQRVVDQSATHGLRPGMDLAAAVRGAADSELWADFATDCVECGACNFVCCTCHCFQLSDGSSEGDAVRGKQWDGCLLMNFARVAGGENPRAGRAKRLRNRFQKKFDYFPEVLGCYACDGCGRCSEVCTGNIDIREVLKRAVDETQSVHADLGND